jgi:hypothetical protein
MSTASTSGWIGALVAVRKLRGRAALLIAATTVGFAAVAAFAERRTLAADAPSRVLQGPVFGLAIPLATLALLSVSLSGGRLDQAMNGPAMLGANRRAAAVGALLGVAVVATFLSAIAAGCAALVAHGPLRGSSLSDAFTSSWIGMLSAIGYTGLFGAGSTFGRRGGGRTLALVADLALGPTVGTATFVLPRAHSLVLLGSTPTDASFSQPMSCAALVLIAVGWTLLAAVRVRP